jgi:hypothetical protein
MNKTTLFVTNDDAVKALVLNLDFVEQILSNCYTGMSL